MARRSRVRGDFKLRRTLRNIHQEMDNQLRPAMQKAADLVLELQKSSVRVSDGPGPHARDALEAFVSKSGLDAQIGIRGKKDNREFFYLKFLEYGTKGYSGQSRAGGRKRSDKNKSDGAQFFGKYPDIPARPAHPWLRPSYDMNRERIVEIIERAVRDTLARASSGVSDD
ncbi:hypothetical protein 9F2_9 [uncultured Caudovirales phage]|uniref:HK97 gp10 family phage protein n=1 Tax=uncultured Caudovirales phage TaxID=2100421 RepID=A0A2H4J8D5_9CAUD|nr:hypothetical protein 9F2_9 [uncultured Caudovirales phage]